MASLVSGVWSLSLSTIPRGGLGPVGLELPVGNKADAGVGAAPIPLLRREVKGKGW